MDSKDWAITNCRVSDDSQLENNSLHNQNKAVMQAARELDVFVPDDGKWSGSVSSKRGLNVERKDIKEMQDYCKKHKRVKYLIIDEPDRFMRSVDEAFHFEVEFRMLGVKVWYASDDTLNSDNMQAKLMRFMKYFVAEGSNEERQRKSINGNTAAVLDGRYPSCPKLGYMAGDEPGVHKIEPVIGEFMRSVLNRLSCGLIGLSESVKEFNNSSFVKSGKHCSYQLDKWRKIVSDPYYCGVVEINRQVKARCENGRHEPLITKEQHEKIKQLVDNRKKTIIGPKPGGNPFFPLNKITLCEKCWNEENSIGRTGFKNRGKYVGFKVKNPDNIQYGYYRCRLCGRCINRDKLHKSMTELLNNIDFSDDSREEFKRQLMKVWELEEAHNGDKINQLQYQLRQVIKQKNEFVDKLGTISSPAVVSELEKSIIRKISERSAIEQEIERLSETEKEGRIKFMDFALEFIDNLGMSFWTLTPEEVRKFKLLAFPEGFFIDSEKIIKTRKISPFLRYKKQKLAFEKAKNAVVVRVKRL